MFHDVCPVCGEYIELSCVIAPGIPDAEQHRCDPKKLAAIDRVMQTDRVSRRVPSEAERLKDGFAMLEEDDLG